MFWREPNGHEDSEGKGTWRIQWSILRRASEQWSRLGRGSITFKFATKKVTVVDSARRPSPTIRFYRDIGSSLGHSSWSGHGKPENLFNTMISISCCGHGTAAVGPDRAGPNCDGARPATTFKFSVADYNWATTPSLVVIRSHRRRSTAQTENAAGLSALNSI
jgi:hypothetical protein